MPTLVLTRHGLTERSHPEQHLGQRIDIGLSDDGRTQADALARRIARFAFERIVSSPLTRAVETAERIAAARPGDAPRQIERDPRLLEMDYGAWEGLTYAQIEERFGAERRRWEADPAGQRCPGGESGNDVAARVRSLLEDLVGEETAAPTLLVGHSSTNRILVCVALAIPIREYRLRIVQSQVNLTTLAWEPGAAIDRASLRLLNDVAHVSGPDEAPWD